MELDELKTAWQQQELTLAETRKTNEQLLRTMLQHRSTDAVGRMLHVEYLSFAVSLLVLLILLCSIRPLSATAELQACFITVVFITLAGVIWGFYKIRLLQGFRFGQAPVAALAGQLERFRLMVVKERISAFTAGPVYMALLLPLAHTLVHGPTFHWADYGLKMVLGCITMIALSILWYRKSYFSNIQSIQQHLAEIDAFRQ